MTRAARRPTVSYSRRVRTLSHLHTKTQNRNARDIYRNCPHACRPETRDVAMNIRTLMVAWMLSWHRESRSGQSHPRVFRQINCSTTNDLLVSAFMSEHSSNYGLCQICVTSRNNCWTQIWLSVLCVKTTASYSSPVFLHQWEKDEVKATTDNYRSWYCGMADTKAYHASGIGCTFESEYVSFHLSTSIWHEKAVVLYLIRFM